MSVFNSISVAVLVVLLVAGAFVGLSAAGTDLLNPNTSSAEADRVRAKTEHDSIMNRLEEQRETVKTEAEITSIQRQQEAEQKRFEAEQLYIEQLYAKKLTAYDGLMRVRDTFLLALGLSMSGSLFLFVGGKVLVMYRTVPVNLKAAQVVIPPIEKTITPMPERITSNPWTSPVYRSQRIEAARQEEKKQRINETSIKMETFKDPARMSKEEYNKSPLVS